MAARKGKTIDVVCEGAATLSFQVLQTFQGDLKQLSKANYARLRKRILEHGFSAPFFVWRHKKDYKILDGHQRLIVITDLHEEGFTIPDLPVCWIDAKSERDARQRVLEYASQFGVMTEGSLSDFAANAQIDAAMIVENFRIPEINMGKLLVPEDEDDTSISQWGDAKSELEGAAALKEDMEYELDLPWGIPPLRSDMLAEIPEPMSTWGSYRPEEADDVEDEKLWWLYLIGRTMIGLPFERAVLGFYAWDDAFEAFWADPPTFVGKIINLGFKIALTPNFSLWPDQARACHLWNTYRVRWCGRYLQEAGVPVIPDVNWCDMESLEYSLIGLPPNAPAIAVQTQNAGSPAEARAFTTAFEVIMERLAPQRVLVYGHVDRSRTMMLDSAVPLDQCVFIPTVSDVSVKTRKKLAKSRRDA